VQLSDRAPGLVLGDDVVLPDSVTMTAHIDMAATTSR
jgi:hypothetical protein